MICAAGCCTCRKYPARNAGSVLQAADDEAPPSGAAAAAVVLQGAAEKPIHVLPLEERLHALPLPAGMAVHGVAVMTAVGGHGGRAVRDALS